jgi:hypothetical protein
MGHVTGDFVGFGNPMGWLLLVAQEMTSTITDGPAVARIGNKPIAAADACLPWDLSHGLM